VRGIYCVYNLKQSQAPVVKLVKQIIDFA